MDAQRPSIDQIRARKNGEPIVCLTDYTAPMARILDRHADILLVGDSIGNVLYGMDNTLGVDLEMMIRHGQAVMRGAAKAMVVIDMPFGTYEESPEHAYRNASRIMQETACAAVKLEGGQDMAETIKYLTAKNIPVMAHIGLLPQSVMKDGGYKIKGKTDEDETRLIADAKAIEQAGAFSVVIEGVIESVAAAMTKAINIPTIGIGASVSCDGQVLVAEDMLGFLEGHTAKFVKKYANLAAEIDKAAASYASDVRARKFPDDAYTYKRSK